MRRAPLLAWLLLFLYGTWLLAFQGWLARPQHLGPWTPDLGLVLLVALGARLTPPRTRIASLLVALSRAAFSADPPLALCAGYLGVAGASSFLRAGIQVDGPLSRSLLTAVFAFVLACLWIGARAVALAASPLAASSELPVPWPVALSSAVAALFLVPCFHRLPGLRALRRRRV